MKTFIRNFKLAFTQSELYQNPSAFPIRGGIYHIIGLSIITSMVAVIGIISIGLPLIEKGAQYGASFADKYPENLTLTLKDNVLSMSAESPYTISYKKVYNETATSTGPIEINRPESSRADNFLVIDTNNDISLSTFNSYKTDMLFGKDGVISRDSSGSLRINYYKTTQIKELVISKAKITDWNNRIQGLARAMTPLIISVIGFFLLGLITVGSFTSFLVASLLGALVIQLVARAKGWDWEGTFSYQNSLTVALYAISIKAVTNLTDYIIPLPWYFTAALFVALIIGFIPTKKEPDAEQTKALGQEEVK